MLIAGSIVLAGLADKVIVARTAFQHAVAIPGQRIAEARPENGFEIGECVETRAMRILLHGFAQVHGDKIRRMLVAHRVGTSAAVECVVPQPAFDHVVIAVTGQDVVEI